MRNPLHILTKNTSSWVVFSWGILLLLPIRVTAVKLETVTVDSQMTMNLSDEGNARVEYVMEIQNDDQELVSGMIINLPFAHIDNLQIYTDGNALSGVTEGQNKTVTVSINLESFAIRNNQTSRLTMRFDVEQAVTSDSGFHQLYIPQVDSDYNLNSSKLVVNYPEDYFSPSYISTTNLSTESNQIELSSLNGYLVLWGDEAVYDLHSEFGFSVPEDELAMSIFSLPLESADQDVLFTNLSAQVDTIQDKKGNLWGAIDYDQQDRQVVYETRIHRFRLPQQVDSFTTTDVAALELPEELRAVIGDVDTMKKLLFIHNYLVDTYQPDMEMQQLGQEWMVGLKEAKQLSGIQYAYLFASYAASLEIPVRVVYGYMMGLDRLGEFNANMPVVYIEAEVDERIVLIDPFLEDVSGYDMFDAPFFNRVQLGIWDPTNKFDSMLGILTGVPLQRPKIISLGEIDQKIDYDVQIEFPGEVLAGNYYQGEISIINKSGYTIELGSVLLNNKEYLSPVVTISDNFFRVVRPLGETRLVLGGLIEEDLFSSSSRSGKLTIKPTDPVFPTKATNYSLSFRANVELVVAAVGICVGITVTGGFWFYRRGLRKRKLTKSYIVSQEMQPVPILN